MPPTRDGDPISLPAAYDAFVTRVLLTKDRARTKLAQGTGVRCGAVNASVDRWGMRRLEKTRCGVARKLPRTVVADVLVPPVDGGIASHSVDRPQR